MKNLKTALLMMVTFLIIQPKAEAQLNSQNAKAQIQKTLNKEFKADEPGVTLLVAQKGEVIFTGAAGMANLELNVPMQADHVLRIGSITKQFTAVAILMLEEQGKLNLQDDLTNFLPTYPTHGKKITIEHLLTHTSGIRSYTSIPDLMDNLRIDRTTQEVAKIFQEKDMLFEPGEEFSYNNSGYFLLGMVIEEASGMTYEDFIEKNIFEKIGMSDSYYGQPDQIIPRRAAGYELENGEIVNAEYLSMTLPYAAGSLLSTVDDLYKWNQAIHSYKLISKASLEKAHKSYVLKNGEATNYGYGWGVNSFYNSETVQHSGGINGFVTNAMYLPKEDIFIAAFSNGKDPEFLTKKIVAQMLGKYPETKKIKVPKSTLESYVGIYQVENSKQKRTIRIQGDHLTSIRTGGELYNLYPFEEDKFYFENSLTIFEFKKDKTGKVKGILAHLPNGKKGKAVKTDEVIKEQKEIQLDDNILQQYVGKYQIEPGFFLEFTLEKNSLWIQPTGDSKMQVFAKGGDNFFVKKADATLLFEKEGDEFKIVKVNLGGRMHIGKKI